MSRIVKTLKKTAPYHEMNISILLPGYYCRGNYHSYATFYARLSTDNEIILGIQVEGEDSKKVLDEQWSMDADDLHISALPRKVK